MKKSLKMFLLSALTSNILVSHVATTSYAEENTREIPSELPLPETPIESGEEAPNEGDPETPTESGSENTDSGEEASSSDSENSENGSVPESSNPPQSEQELIPTTPEYQPESNIIPREQPRTAITSSEVADEFYATANLENLTNLLASSLEDEDFLTAWQDYQELIKNYKFKDKQKEESTVSTLSEILDGFEAGVQAEEVTTSEGQSTLVFRYGSDVLEEGENPVQMILYSDDEGYLVGAALLQATTTQGDSSPVSVDLIQSLFLKSHRDLYAEQPFVKAFYQELSNDVVYTTIALASQNEDSVELVVIDNQLVLNHVTTEITETALIFKLQELTQIFIDTLSEDVSSEEESDEESISGVDETMDGAESIDSNSLMEEATPFVKKYAPTDYEVDKLTAYDQLSEGYQSLLNQVEDNQLLVTDEAIINLLGEPASRTAGGNSTYYSYYSIEDDRIVLLDIQLDSQSHEVKTILYDDRRPSLDEAFKITVEDLFAIAEEELSIENLINSLGEPNLVEHLFVGTYQRRNVWTSYADPEMRNIEAFEEVSSGNIELFYYDQVEFLD